MFSLNTKILILLEIKYKLLMFLDILITTNIRIIASNTDWCQLCIHIYIIHQYRVQNSNDSSVRSASQTLSFPIIKNIKYKIY